MRDRLKNRERGKKKRYKGEKDEFWEYAIIFFSQIEELFYINTFVV